MLLGNGCYGENSGSTSSTIPAPTYFLTNAECFKVPPVGGTATLSIVNASDNLVQNQWLQHPLGAFKITGISGSSVIIRNSCDNGDAVLGNATPGTKVCGVLPVWVSINPHCENFDFFQSALSQMEDICFTSILDPQSSETEFCLFGGTKTECVGPCSPDPDPLCLRKLSFLFVENGNLVLEGGNIIIRGGGNVILEP